MSSAVGRLGPTSPRRHAERPGNGNSMASIDRPPGGGTTDKRREGPEFPRLERMSPDQRAAEVIDALREAIQNPGRDDGSSGMHYTEWSKLARKEIAKAIREAETTAVLGETLSPRRLGGFLLKLGCFLLAAAASFLAFWWGILQVGQLYGFGWGVAAGLSGAALAVAFSLLGLHVEDPAKALREGKAGPESRRR